MNSKLKFKSFVFGIVYILHYFIFSSCQPIIIKQQKSIFLRIPVNEKVKTTSTSNEKSSLVQNPDIKVTTTIPLTKTKTKSTAAPTVVNLLSNINAKFLRVPNNISGGSEINRINTNPDNTAENNQNSKVIPENIVETNPTTKAIPTKKTKTNTVDILIPENTTNIPAIEDNQTDTTENNPTEVNSVNIAAIFPKIIVQPTKLNVVNRKNQSATLECKAEIPNYDIPVTYQWYESSDKNMQSAKPVINDSSNSSIFTTPPFSEKGIKYYRCVVIPQISVRDGEKLNSVTSVIVSVAYTGLPTVKLNTPNNDAITSKEEWMDDATLTIEGAEQDKWDIEEIKTGVRGRGNYTWKMAMPKKPYALKLNKKLNILGMPKNKRWNLIANYLDNSFMRNEIAFYLSEQIGLEWTVHGKFVDLFVNGEYLGLYWLGESIKVDETRININDGSETMTDDEDKDYLLEMDVYYDEPVKFKSSIRNMPYMIRNEDYMVDTTNRLTRGGQARLHRLQNKISELEKMLYPNARNVRNLDRCSAPTESYSSRIDIDSWAKFWIVSEAMSNGELLHPKSCYFTFDSTNSLLKAGPVWDFDWASNSRSTSCELKNSIYYNALFKATTFREKLKEIWVERSDRIDISSRIEALREELSVAAEYDAKLWDVNHNPGKLNFSNFHGNDDNKKKVLITKLNVVSNEINRL